MMPPNERITLQAGQIVLVRGFPMRLLADVEVESHMNNFRAAGLWRHESENEDAKH